MTQLKTIRHFGEETGTWVLNQNKEKKHTWSFSKHFKSCIIQIIKIEKKIHKYIFLDLIYIISMCVFLSSVVCILFIGTSIDHVWRKMRILNTVYVDIIIWTFITAIVRMIRF